MWKETSRKTDLGSCNVDCHLFARLERRAQHSVLVVHGVVGSAISHVTGGTVSISGHELDFLQCSAKRYNVPC